MRVKAANAKQLMSRQRTGAMAVCVGLLVLSAQSAAAQTTPEAAVSTAPITEAKRQRMEQQLQELLNMRSEFDRRIRALEVDLHGSAAPSAVTATGAASPGAA